MSEPTPLPAEPSDRWSALTSTRRATGPLLRFAGSLPAHFFRALIWVYQKTLSPALVVIAPSCGCRFAPTCSHYASEALRTHGFVTGVGLTLLRLAKCGPWHPGGHDPVPPSPKLRRTGLPICRAVGHHS